MFYHTIALPVRLDRIQSHFTGEEITASNFRFRDGEIYHVPPHGLYDELDITLVSLPEFQQVLYKYFESSPSDKINVTKITSRHSFKVPNRRHVGIFYVNNGELMIFQAKAKIDTELTDVFVLTPIY